MLRKLCALAAVLAAVLLASAGCADNSAKLSESAVEAEDNFTVVHKYIEDEQSGGAESREPVVECPNDDYYEYDGRRYWLDLSEPGSIFIQREGKYTRIPDIPADTAEADTQEFAIYGMMESFNEQSWRYAGSLEQERTGRIQRFFLDSTGETMLLLTELDPAKDGYSQVELGEGETLVGAAILRRSLS